MHATVDTANGLTTLRFERRFRHSPEKVWRAITDPAELSHWFPQDLEGRFAPGARLRFVFRGEPPVLDGEVLREFSGEVLEFDPPRLLAYTWGGDTLRWSLTPDGDGCLLVFTDAFTDLGKAARDGAGWHVCLDALAARLAGAQAGSGTGGRSTTRGTRTGSAPTPPRRPCPAEPRPAHPVWQPLPADRPTPATARRCVSRAPAPCRVRHRCDSDVLLCASVSQRCGSRADEPAGDPGPGRSSPGRVDRASGADLAGRPPGRRVAGLSVPRRIIHLPGSEAGYML